ncbi:putative Holliday junction resolvase [Breznakia sp. PF5-3]|uniref:Holliday junction resolvase RuvX n=1 Tax=unclassified Breznakia TaxID=2623764 RepID=UPI0024065E2A|nr:MULTISPECIES: Holliday junction resolvase RuvX [unclassified Breznakia]MDF9825323.1 putative Holliday junction resolvase [Breznakia sp. PM6-1]MDF9836178.1 putative Holliday junction resolvase [Breznakia sp. PF5-3]MDF9838424.1 putative Holliday junction resolvase [Breznakia sp. PFB2-8]MDF9860440.1 putative Holliday junction resolvase [Breznakia sp. PH5-24]
MEKIIGLDLGSVTCGVSVSDLMGIIASSVKTIRFPEDDYDTCLEEVLLTLKENNSNTVVLGLPKHMNGDIGIRGNISIDFKEKLEAHDVKVILWDERLTTVSAEKILIGADVSRKKRKKVIDQMAAVTILQDYLNSLK